MQRWIRKLTTRVSQHALVIVFPVTVDTFNFSTKVCVPRCVHDIDTSTFVSNGCRRACCSTLCCWLRDQSIICSNAIIKQNVYLTDFDDFEAFNKVSAEYLGDHRPARATMKVLELPKGARMGLDVVAALPR